MKSKKRILISTLIILIICLGLGLTWFLTTEEILQSSTYMEMFEIEGLEQEMSPMEQGIIENMTLDIVRISDEINGIATATINITIPDVPSIFIETVESFPNIENMSESAFKNRLTSNMQNQFITLREEFEVIQQGGMWRILNSEDIDNLINDQITALFIRILEYTEFEPITLPF